MHPLHFHSFCFQREKPLHFLEPPRILASTLVCFLVLQQRVIRRSLCNPKNLLGKLNHSIRRGNRIKETSFYLIHATSFNGPMEGAGKPRRKRTKIHALGHDGGSSCTLGRKKAKMIKGYHPSSSSLIFLSYPFLSFLLFFFKRKAGFFFNSRDPSKRTGSRDPWPLTSQDACTHGVFSLPSPWGAAIEGLSELMENFFINPKKKTSKAFVSDRKTIVKTPQHAPSPTVPAKLARDRNEAQAAQKSQSADGRQQHGDVKSHHGIDGVSSLL